MGDRRSRLRPCSYDYSSTESVALLLFDVPSLMPLPSSLADQRNNGRWGAQSAYLVRIDDTGAQMGEVSVLLTQDNRLLTRNTSLMSFEAAVDEVGSVFAPARLAPGRYALTKVVGQANMNPITHVERVVYCPASPPVFEIVAGAVNVVDFAELNGIPSSAPLWGRNAQESSLDRARALLAEYPEIRSNPVLVHPSGTVQISERPSGGGIDCPHGD